MNQYDGQWTSAAASCADEAREGEAIAQDHFRASMACARMAEAERLSNANWWLKCATYALWFLLSEDADV